MNLGEIKEAIENGKTVCWSNDGYEVKKYDGKELDEDTWEYVPVVNYEIVCLSNQHMIGLTWVDGVTLNGKEKDFYIKGEQ